MGARGKILHHQGTGRAYPAEVAIIEIDLGSRRPLQFETGAGDRSRGWRRGRRTAHNRQCHGRIDVTTGLWMLQRLGFFGTVEDT